MPATQVAPKLISWGSDVEPDTLRQAEKASRLDFVPGHVALMPDAHVGMGATVGSVIPTESAIIPAAVGVDIGCGMVATLTNLVASDLPDDLDALMPLIERRVPAGVGKGHESVVDGAALDMLGLPNGTELSTRERVKIELQFGTLGSGNHFVEVCLDEDDYVWVVLHSGSRGIGNQLAQRHISNAKGLMKLNHVRLEDPDLAYLIEGSEDFQAYITDMLWCQRYAFESRATMSTEAVASLFEVVGRGRVLDTINCHHNFTQ